MSSIKNIKITVIFILVLIASCSNNDDFEKNIQISGTSWEGTGEIKSFTFTSITDFYYRDTYGGDEVNGTYTFSNGDGILTEQYGTTEFYINNELLTIDYNNGTGDYAYNSGIETFIKK